MAKKKKTTYASFSPDAAIEGGGFEGGITKIKSATFGTGYPAQDGSVKNPELITFRLVHTPKGDSEPRTEILSCGKSAAKHFRIASSKTRLIAKHAGAALHRRSGFMVLMTSLQEAGFPRAQLDAGDAAVLKACVLEMAQQPVVYEGLVDEETGKDRRSTQLICTRVVKTPFDADSEGEEEDDDKTFDEEDMTDDLMDPEGGTDDDDDDEEETDEDEDEDEDEADEDAEEEGEEDVPIVKPAALAKYLRAILTKAGGTLTVQKLGKAAWDHLKTSADRNVAVPLLVEETFLGTEKGWTYNKKAKTLTLDED